MFTEEELQSIDTKYFMMITVDPYDVTIQSRNTGHYWYLHSTGYPTEGSCIIFHKHRSSASSPAAFSMVSFCICSTSVSERVISFQLCKDS